MPATTAMMLCITSFYRSNSTPPYSDRSLVKDAPLALAASNPRNRFAVEKAAQYISPTLKMHLTSGQNERDMLSYEDRESNQLLKDHSAAPDSLGVRAIYLEHGEADVALERSLWWLCRPISRSLTVPLPATLYCQSATTTTFDLRPLASRAHLLSLTVRLCRELTTILLPTPTDAYGPLRSISLDNCDQLAHIRHTNESPANSASADADLSVLSTIRIAEIYSRGAFQLDPFLPVCTQLEVLRGFTPADCEANGLRALSHLTHLRVFDICSSNLSSLSGIEACRALETCECRECFGLDDVTPLSGLPRLRKVALTMTAVETIEPLLACPRLEVLSVSSCEQLSELPLFPPHCVLRDLDISYTTLSDLTPLANCTSLETICINNCSALHDLDPVLRLPKLTNIDFEEGVALEGVPSLLFKKDMYLYEWRCATHFTGDFSALQSINLNSCETIPSLSGLENAVQLRSAEFCRCPALTDLSALANKMHLSAVEIEDCPVDSLEWARTCPELHSVSISGCTTLSDLTPLFESPSAPQLEKLVLSGCSAIPSAQLNRIGEFTAGRHLTCADVPVTSIERLVHWQSLRTLTLSRCESLTGSLGVLSTLPNLECIDASQTCITSVLPSLQNDTQEAQKLFPALTRLSLVRCEQLTHLVAGDVPGDHARMAAASVVLFPKLEKFVAFFTSLADITVLAGCRSLTSVDVNNSSRLTSLSGFFARILEQAKNTQPGEALPLSALTTFDISTTGVTTFSDDTPTLTAWLVAHCTHMQQLNVQGCPLDESTTALVRAWADANNLEEADYAPGRFSAPVVPIQKQRRRE